MANAKRYGRMSKMNMFDDREWYQLTKAYIKIRIKDKARDKLNYNSRHLS